MYTQERKEKRVRGSTQRSGNSANYGYYTAHRGWSKGRQKKQNTEVHHHPKPRGRQGKKSPTMNRSHNKATREKQTKRRRVEWEKEKQFQTGLLARVVIRGRSRSYDVDGALGDKITLERTGGVAGYRGE